MKAIQSSLLDVLALRHQVHGRKVQENGVKLRAHFPQGHLWVTSAGVAANIARHSSEGVKKQAAEKWAALHMQVAPRNAAHQPEQQDKHEDQFSGAKFERL